MKQILALAVLILAGCSTPPAQPAPTPSTATPESVASQTSAAPESKAPEKPVKKDPRDKPERIYSLSSLGILTFKTPNGKTLKLWLMDDESKRAEGMMWLTDPDVKENEGMLFAMGRSMPKDIGFWMKNTILPLDIIYLSAEKKVLNVAHGKPHDETNLPAKADYSWVIELKSGRAPKFGLTPGTKLQLDAPTGQ